MAQPPSCSWTPFEASYRRAVSVERLRRYRKDRDKQSWAPAIGRYLYNIELSGALYPVLNWAEVALRNHLHEIIGGAFPLGNGRSFDRVSSWLDARPAILLPKEQEKVAEAITGFDRRNTPRRGAAKTIPEPKILTEGRLVAELRFGFWTHLLDGVYSDWRKPNNPLFWPRLLDRAFPHCPTLEKTRKHIHVRFTEIKEIRNRTFHHERISHLATLEFYDRVLEAVAWIHPALADDLRDKERPRFREVLDAGPQPFVTWAVAKAALY